MLSVLVGGSSLVAQEASDTPPLDGRDGRALLLKNFRPESQLQVAEHLRTKAAFPVVDVHTHFHYKLRSSEQALDDFVSVMNRNNIAVCASLDGNLDGQLDEHMRYLWTKYRDRFVIYANVDWRGDGDKQDHSTWACHRTGFAERTVEQLQVAVQRGVSGLKVFKRYGLGYRNPDGSLIEIDDPRFDPIWDSCGKLGIPIIIHTADPAAFFDPIDETNERWEELSRHPDWSFHGDDFPSRRELLDARNRMIAKHPQTQFIGAHVGNSSEDLETVARWLEEYPNLWVETASRISELGRQPITARRFLIRYADRVLFGTDGPWPEARLKINWRFFETRDESFAYSEKSPPPQGFWQIHGVHLPRQVLRKLYFENASRLIPGVEERLEKYQAMEVGAQKSREGASVEREGASVDREGARADREGARADREGASVEREEATVERSGPIVSSPSKTVVNAVECESQASPRKQP
ncbi:MAG: amidohydrolase family protein [Rubripirellula sp.]